MRRLTVTLEDEVTAELQALPLRATRAALQTALGSASAIEDKRAPLWSRLSRSVDELGDRPSASAVIRQAVRFYLAALAEARSEAELEAGYAVLSQDAERSEMLDAHATRAPGRWSEDR